MGDIRKIRENAKYMFDVLDIEVEDGHFVNHTFTSSINVYIMLNGEQECLDVSIKADYIKWKKYIFERIDQACSFEEILYDIRNPYRCTFLKLCWQDNALTEKEMSVVLADIWMRTEFPNSNPDVTKTDYLDMFRHAKKKIIMNKDEFTFWMSLSGQITVYRGVGSSDSEDGLSYSLDYEKAVWFAKRFCVDGNFKRVYVIKALINKEACLAYFNRRNEQEIVVDTDKIICKEILCVE